MGPDLGVADGADHAAATLADERTVTLTRRTAPVLEVSRRAPRQAQPWSMERPPKGYCRPTLPIQVHRGATSRRRRGRGGPYGAPCAAISDTGAAGLARPCEPDGSDSVRSVRGDRGGRLHALEGDKIAVPLTRTGSLSLHNCRDASLTGEIRRPTLPTVLSAAAPTGVDPSDRATSATRRSMSSPSAPRRPGGRAVARISSA